MEKELQLRNKLYKETDEWELGERPDKVCSLDECESCQ